MLPILFKIEFNTPTMQVIGVLLCIALVGYGFWSGWRGADPKETAVWRGIPFAIASALAGLVGVIFMAPPLSETGAAVVKALVWGFSGALAATAALYAVKVRENPLWFGGIGAAVGIAAIKFERAPGTKCPRCWNYSEAIDAAHPVCPKCAEALKG